MNVLLQLSEYCPNNAGLTQIDMYIMYIHFAGAKIGPVMQLLVWLQSSVKHSHCEQRFLGTSCNSDLDVAVLDVHQSAMKATGLLHQA